THLPQTLIRKPFAYRPPKKFNRVDRVSSSADFNRAFLLRLTFVLGNLGYYRNVSRIARVIFADCKSCWYCLESFPCRSLAQRGANLKRFLPIKTLGLTMRRAKLQ